MNILQKHSSFHVGDRVRFDFGRRKVAGLIVEDRGAIGGQGRHLFSVQIPMDPHDPMVVELPEDEIEAIAEGTETAPRIKKAKIVEYLENGGLISILRSNISGGPNPPKVWLCLDNLGNVTHTFISERGVIGGEIPPFWAMHDDKVFTAKRESVVAFVKTFGLSRKEAEKVISKVGTAP